MRSRVAIQKNNDKIKTVIVNNEILNVHDNPKEVSNVFNNYFTDVGKNLAKIFKATFLTDNKW